MTDSLWEGGAEDYFSDLSAHYEPLLKDLRACRDNADDIARAELDSEIQRLEKEYNSKLDSIDDSLF